MSWPLDPVLDDAALETKLYPPPAPSHHGCVMPDFDSIHREMRRKDETLMLLWQEYKQNSQEAGFQYSQFCEHYKRFKKQLDVVMRQEHHAGDKLFVDFSGDGIPITDPETGEVREAELFVAVLGASNCIFAMALPSQNLPCWIGGHVLAYEHLGGVPSATIPDDTKTAVTAACYFEPDRNATYLEMARH